MKPGDVDYEYLQKVYTTKLNDNRVSSYSKKFLSLTTEREKWNFINEVRNSVRTKTDISCLRNSFGDLETDQKRIANLLNYRFSKLGDLFGDKN